MENQNLQKGNFYLIIAIIIGVFAIGVVGSVSWKYFGEVSELGKNESKIIKPSVEKETEEFKTASKSADKTIDWKTYQSSDGVLRAQIIPIGKTQESKIQIRTNKGTLPLLKEADYSSEDGDHGLRVIHAKWTPDSQFFIYSAVSSGGHQPWFSRVYFYSRSNNKIYCFKDISGFTVASDEFTVIAPDVVKFTVYTSTGMGPKITKSFKLSDVIKSDKTANWKTYRNTKYGFEIKYPKDWKVDDAHVNSVLPHLFIEKEEVEKGEHIVNIDIKMEEMKGSNQSLEEIIDKNLKQMMTKMIICPKRKIQIGKNEGYEVIGVFCTQYCTGSPKDIYNPIALVYFSYKNKFYEITYIEGIEGIGWKEDIKDWKYYNIFRKILFSLEFIE